MAAQRDGVPNKQAEIFCKYTCKYRARAQILNKWRSEWWSLTDGGSSLSVTGSPASAVQLALFFLFFFF